MKSTAPVRTRTKSGKAHQPTRVAVNPTLPPHFNEYDERLWPILATNQRIRRRRDFTHVSPFAYRYTNQELAAYTSEEARIKYQGAVEASIVIELYARGLCSKRAVMAIIKGCCQLTAAEVYRLEYGVKGRVKGLKHDVRALIKRLKRLVDERYHRYLHLMATSCDILNTADAARIRDALISVIIPGLKKVLRNLIHIAQEYADTVQVGRTHLQHASPQTFGNAVCEYVVRLGGEIVKLEKEAARLNGKFSGPVGTYGPSSLILTNPRQFERGLLRRLGLKPGRYSTQITMPEPLADVYHRLTVIMGIFADLADSFRRLQATEVAEVATAKSDQGSSSIMAHKNNPIACENIKSMFKTEVGRLIGVFLDLISDHQRDLTNSASGRFHVEILEFVATAIKTLNRILPNLQVDESQMMKNLELTGDLIISDPLNTLLTHLGFPNAHAYVGALCDQSAKTGTKVYELVMSDEALKPYVRQMTPKQLRVLRMPKRYIGYASRRTKTEARYWIKRLRLAA